MRGPPGKQDLRLIRALTSAVSADRHTVGTTRLTHLRHHPSGCAYRKSSPSILVMQSTQDRTTQNASRCLGGT